MITKVHNYQTFQDDFDNTFGDEWSCLFELNHQQLNLKNRNIATKKFKIIIECVFKISHNKGFQAMTMRDLSQESGISMGGLYKYFSNKNQLVEMIHACMVHIAEVCLKISNESELDPILELNKILANHLYLSERLKKWFYFVFMEAKSLEKPLIETIIASEQMMENTLYQYIIEANNKGLCACDNPEFIAPMLKVMLQEWYLKSWKYQQKNIHVDQYVANLILSAKKLMDTQEN